MCGRDSDWSPRAHGPGRTTLHSEQKALLRTACSGYALLQRSKHNTGFFPAIDAVFTFKGMEGQLVTEIIS